MNNIDILYVDMIPDFSKEWSNDIGVARGTRAVKNSIMGIVSTRKGTRPFDPNFGCDLYDQLFENMNPLVRDTIQTSIIDAIRTYEPRVVKLRVDVTPVYDNNEVLVTINFSIEDNPDKIELLKFKLR